MTPAALAAVSLYLAVLTALAVPLGAYVARVLSADPRGGGRLGRLERRLYRLAGSIPPSR